MKNNIIRIIFLIMSLGLFIAMIIFTNDNIKEKIETSRLIPMIGIVSIMLVSIILLWKRINKL